MADGDLKTRLLQTLAASAERERELHGLADDAPPAGQNAWGARDHIAHLAHWRRHAAAVLTAVRTGDPPPDSGDVDAVNAQVYAANQGRSAEDVKDDARASYAELARAIDDCSEEDLMKPRPGRDFLTWEVVPPNGHLHLGEHLGFWHQAHGDEAAADHSQQWMMEVHEAAFTDGRSRAFGAYNLACYYARQGRADEAIPYLQRSIELHRSLKEWARKDPDLDQIRHEPRLRAILE